MADIVYIAEIIEQDKIQYKLFVDDQRYSDINQECLQRTPSTESMVRRNLVATDNEGLEEMMHDRLDVTMSQGYIAKVR